MPYFITDRHPDCDGWALVKEDGEFVFCHPNQPAAQDHMIAISLSEDLEPGGEYEGDTFRTLDSRDLPDAYRPSNSEDVPEGRACGNCIFYKEDKQNDEGLSYCERWEEYVRGDYYCNAWEAEDSYRNEDPSTPADPDEQIEGSDVNEPGSASGAGGDIELSERVERALRNKVREHNESMEEDDRPDWTRTTFGQLAAVYRRGAGAFSASHRPSQNRASWAMARVNAYLYLLRNGEPENSAYITDNDLLPEDHPKSTRGDRSLEQRDVNLVPPAYMRAAARRGLELYEQGLAGDGLTDRTVTEARQMARGQELTPDKWTRIAAWIARHMTDLEAEQNQPGGEGFPGPGAVAFYLWGVTPTDRGANRVMDYAERIVDRIERESEGRVRGEMAKKFETRTFETDFEIREEGEGMTFSGYAALFDSPSHPLPFIERIKPGAFTRSLKSRNNVFMFYNHDSSEILASSRAGTLRLYEDDRGLRVEADIAPTSRGRDVSTLIKRGDLYGMSFGFSVPTGGDEWNSDGTERTLKSVRLGEVSIVASAAYPQTEGTVAVRGLDKVAQRAEVDVDALADALVKLETGEQISDQDKSLLTNVIDSLAPKSEEVEEEADGEALLQLKKKKLELLMKGIA